MSHRLRSSTSSSRLTAKEPGCDVSEPDNAQDSTRVRKLQEGLSPLKIPTVPHEPQKTPEGKKMAVAKSEAVLRLARLKVLPPLSPEGRDFASSVRDGSYTCVDVVGEGLLQFLQDGVPGYEVVFGRHKACNIKCNIEALRRGDPKEIRRMMAFGVEFEPVDRWTAEERSKVGRYPMAIRTSGPAKVRPVAQPDSGRGDSQCHPLGKVRKRMKCSPESLRTKEEICYSSDSESESPASLATFETSDYEDTMEAFHEGNVRPEGNTAPDEQMNSDDWPRSSDEWSAETSQSSDYDSEEDLSEEDLLDSEDKILHKLFPYARYRES